MQASEGKIGRIFVLRLEDGDRIPDCIETFAADKQIRMAGVTLIGGIGEGQIVVGPRDSAAMPPEPILLPLEGAHEVVGVGLIAPDKNGRPGLHMHASLGRSGQAKTGCLRPGVKTWTVGEVVISEILGTDGSRLPDKNTGFELLTMDSAPVSGKAKTAK
jgi:predicted DNA-binding protein with PD1-like motif